MKKIPSVKKFLKKVKYSDASEHSICKNDIISGTYKY